MTRRDDPRAVLRRLLHDLPQRLSSEFVEFFNRRGRASVKPFRACVRRSRSFRPTTRTNSLSYLIRRPAKRLANLDSLSFSTRTRRLADYSLRLRSNPSFNLNRAEFPFAASASTRAATAYPF
jgi:hypothetical protein